MELAIINPDFATPSRVSSDDRFILSNTDSVTLAHLKEDCVIPVFSKDNQPTISNADFVEAIYEAVQNVFYGEEVLSPAIRVSHPIKGRIPEAKDKDARDLKDFEKTVYYERAMFTIEVPSIYRVINNNHLSLTVGGVRGYHLENLHTKRGPQKFKVFIGYRNRVCCNMCVSTDGILDDIKVNTAGELFSRAEDLLNRHESSETLNRYSKWANIKISEKQFAEFIGRCKMLGFMPTKEKDGYPLFRFTDSHLSLVLDGYYKDKYFGRDIDGSINLWKLYNLFTGANKSSYIDKFLERSINAESVIENMRLYL
jgi:hypothetical protein